MAATAPETEPTIFSRLERLDVMMGYLEEILRGGGRVRQSSCASTTSSGTPTASDGGGDSSVGSSPKRLERRCRPIDQVMVETQLKGSLLDRLRQLEDGVLKLSLHLEEETESERKKEEEQRSPKAEKHHKRGIKSLVKSCVRGKHKSHEEAKD